LDDQDTIPQSGKPRDGLVDRLQALNGLGGAL
jgi:hypothetical protein